MQKEKWEQLKGQVQDSFSNVEISQEDLTNPEKGVKEIVIFDVPLGWMRLEYITRPLVLDKQTHGSRRIGSHTEVEYIYSENEFTHKLVAYKWDEDTDNWVEMEMDKKESFSL